MFFTSWLVSRMNKTRDRIKFDWTVEKQDALIDAIGVDNYEWLMQFLVKNGDIERMVVLARRAVSGFIVFIVGNILLFATDIETSGDGNIAEQIMGLILAFVIMFLMLQAMFNSLLGSVLALSVLWEMKREEKKRRQGSEIHSHSVPSKSPNEL